MSVFKICFPAWVLWFWLKIEKSWFNTFFWFHMGNNVVLIEETITYVVLPVFKNPLAV